MTSEKDLNMRY